MNTFDVTASTRWEIKEGLERYEFVAELGEKYLHFKVS